MSHWSDLPTERITAANRSTAMSTRFTDPAPIAQRFSHRDDWTTRQQSALNQAIVNQTLLASALTNLLTAVQLAMPNMAPAHLLRAEEEAVRALEMVGGRHDL